MATTFTGGVLASLAPWAPSGSAFAIYSEALAGLFEQVYGIVVPQGSPDAPADYTAGWSTLLDPTACPDWALPYVGQFIGVQVPAGTAASAARAQIIAEQNFQVGTANAIIATAKLWLTGKQHVALLERTAADGSTADPYHLCVIVRPEEVIDAGQLFRAVDAVRPVGVQWTLNQVDGTIWSESTHTWSAETATWSQGSLIDP